MKRYINDAEHKKLVSNIVRSITLSDWRPDMVVGITRGGLTAATMISHYFDVPMHTLKISLRDSEEDCESNLWLSEYAFGYVSKDHDDYASNCQNILVVDDINDSGATFNWLIRDWQSSCFPNHSRWKDVWNKNVKFAVVIDNTGSRCDLAMDYIGEEVTKQDNDWIVFPYESWWA